MLRGEAIVEAINIETSLGNLQLAPATVERFALSIRSHLVSGELGPIECDLLDISPGGLLWTCEADLNVGDRIEIELPSWESRTVRIAWAKSGRFGGQFIQRLKARDLSLILWAAAVARERALPETEVAARRSETSASVVERDSDRLPILFEASFLSEEKSFPLSVLNVSKSGFLAFCPSFVEIGSKVVLDMPDRSLPFTVRWALEGHMGCQFDEKLEWADVIHLGVENADPVELRRVC